MPELDTTGLNLEKTDSFDLEGLDLEKAAPEVTAGRIFGRFGYTVYQTPGLFSKMSRSFLEAEDIDALDEKPSVPVKGLVFPFADEMQQLVGKITGRTAMDDAYDQMDVPAQTRVNEKANEYAEIYPDREAFKKAVIEEKKAERKDVIEQMKSFEQQFEMPEKYKESSGFLEDIAGGLGTSVTSAIAGIAGMVFGGPATSYLFLTAAAYSQMHGYKIQELEDIGGVSINDKLNAAILSGAIQAPLEAVSNLFMLSKIMKLNGTWTKFLFTTLPQAGVGEFSTEYLQQWPDTYASVMALNPDRNTAQNLIFMRNNIGEINGEALYAGTVGGAAGMLTVGLGSGGKIATAAMLNKLISPEQKAINEEKAARFEQLATKFEKNGITESEAVELREMVNAPETTEIEEIVNEVKKQLVFQEPIKSETRDSVIKSVRESKKFTDEQVDSYATLWDGIARNWAELEPDRKPEQWYDTWLSEFNAGDFIETANKVYQIAAWHGGPHSFDKFTTEKIGTGEGAQAFGWGLYFTDEESIAKGYVDAGVTGDWLTMTMPDGSEVAWDDLTEEMLQAAKYIEFGEKAAGEFKQNTHYYAEIKAKEAGVSKKVVALIKQKPKFKYKKPPKNLYKVTLHKGKKPGEYEWIEWDKKIAPGAGKKIIAQLLKEKIRLDGINEKMVSSPDEFWMKSRVTGKEIYRNLSERTIGSDKEASLFLLRAGIDGIKYPTGSLSWVKDSKKTNYVVFDEEAVTIDKKLTFQVSMDYIAEAVEEGDPQAKKKKAAIKKMGDRLTELKIERNEKTVDMFTEFLRGVEAILSDPKSTPEQKEQALSGMEEMEKVVNRTLMYQDGKKPLGAMENLFNDSPKIMHAFEGADPSTPIHETGHVLLEMMFQGGHEDYLVAAEWAGVSYEKAMGGTKQWTPEELEKFAKGFEVYLMEGKAPTTRLAEVFKNLKTWLLEVYKSVKALGVELNPEIRDVFDRWVSTEFERENDPIRDVPEWLVADDIKADMKRRELTEAASFEDIQVEARKRVLGALKAKRAKLEKKLEKEFRKEAREMVNENPIYDMLADAKKRGGLNYKDLLNDFGEEYLGDIVKRLPGVVNKNGEHVDTFAMEYGYDTADEMMQAILNTPTKQHAENSHYDDLWRGYESMLEHENITAYEDVIDEEINILNEMLGGKPKARKDLKGIIRKQTGQIKDQEYQELKDGIKQDMVVARKAFSAGKKEAVKQQLEKTKKRLQALKSQVKDRDARRKIDKRMRTIWKSKLLPEYKAQITQILSVYYNIPKSYLIQPEMSLDAFLAEKEEDNETNVNAIRNALLNIPEQKRNKVGYRIPLTLEEKQAMMQPVLSLNHMGRTEKILISEKEKADLDERVLELTTRGYEVFGRPEESEDVILLREKVSWFEKMSETARGYLASTGKLEFIFDILDGGGLGGPNAALFEKYTNALDREMVIGKEYLNKIKKVFKPAKKVKNWANKIHKIEGVPQSYTKEQMFMFALQSASKSGRNALMTGDGFSEQQIDAIVQKLKDQGEWHMVEGVWDVFESLYPMLNDVHRKLTGISLPKVEGKYFPLKYDPVLSRTAGMHEQRAAERDLFHAAYTRPHVEAGSRIARVAGNKPPILLSLNVINIKLTELIHDITHQLPVRDLQKILTNEKYRGMVDNTLGKAYYDQMMPWLAHVAKPRKLKTEGERWADKLRGNTTIVALGLKVSVSLKQAGSITQTVDELNLLTGSKTKGVTLTARAMSDFYRDRKHMVDFINESSPQMANRRKSWNRELVELYNESDIKDFGRSEAARDAYFWMIQAVDSMVTMPSWYAGYLHGMDVYHGDHTKAVKVADKLVRKTQPSANPGDLSLIHRGGKDRSSYVKLTTMFYTHFSNFQNRMWQTKQLHKLGQIDRVEAYASYWWLMVAPGLLGGFLGRREIPKGWDWLTDVIGYSLAGLPVVRDIMGPFLTGYDYTISPVVRGLESPIKVYQYAKGGKISKAAKESVRLSGYIFGLPSDQALITMDGVVDLMSGETNKPQRMFFRKPYKEKKKVKRSL